MIHRLLEVREEFYEKNDLYFSLESEKSFKNLKLNEVHCIYFIKILEKPNVTNLALEMKMTTSGVTKVTSRLAKKGYLKKYKLPENKKEVLFSLTEEGEEIYSIHKKVHEEGYKKNYDFIKRIPEDELKIIINFFEENNKFLDEEIQKMSR